uniref:Single domain-containing protein n=1 Tax=Stomoxys calcitrans TaxID=35570 RepID=A0A1I8Q2F7_STOCA
MYLLMLSLLLLLQSNVINLTFATPSTYARDRFLANSRCVDSETGRELYVGDSFTRSGRCINVQCLDTLQLWEDRCQVPQLEGNCTKIPVANEFLDYPRCCPTYECTSYKTDDNSITYETRTFDRYGRLLTERIMQRVRVLVHHPQSQYPGNGNQDWKCDENGRDCTRTVYPIGNAASRDNVLQIKYT